MPELKVKAHELVDTRTDYVSLVKRAATRLPFRIVKAEDEDMLDLHAIGRKMFAKSEPAPEIVAVVMTTGANADVLGDAFKEAGLDPALFLKSEEDEIVTLAKADSDKAKDTVLIKTSDDVGLIVTGLKKAFDVYSGNTSFSEAIAAQSFYPSLSRATEVLSEVIWHKLQKANTPAEAAAMISECIADFQGYITMMTAALPQSAFYVDRFYENYMKSADGKAYGKKKPADMEKAINIGENMKDGEEDEKKVEKTEEGAPVTAEVETPALETPAVEAALTETPAAEEVAKEEETPAVETPAVVETPAAETPAAEADPVLKSEVDGLKTTQEAILTTLAEIQKSFTTAMSDLGTSLQKEMAEVQTRVEAVAVQAKKTEEALNGTVFSEAGADAPTRVAKSAQESAPPLLDTGFSRRA